MYWRADIKKWTKPVWIHYFVRSFITTNYSAVTSPWCDICKKGRSGYSTLFTLEIFIVECTSISQQLFEYNQPNLSWGRHWANWLAARMILHLKEHFSCKEILLKEFCLPVKTICPLAEKVKKVHGGVELSGIQGVIMQVISK